MAQTQLFVCSYCQADKRGNLQILAFHLTLFPELWFLLKRCYFLTYCGVSPFPRKEVYGVFVGVLLLGSILLSSTFEGWQVSPVSTGST